VSPDGGPQAGAAMGVVIAVEGMEAAGKSSVVGSCVSMLNAAGIRSAVAPEFSSSPLGDYLLHRLTRDRFMRDPDNPRSAWTQILSVAADTAYSLEYTLPELSAAHQVVLKDRYRESLVACQAVALADEYGISDRQACEVLLPLASNLPDIADGLIWLEAPEAVRRERLERSGEFDDRDQPVYRRRELAYRWLMANSEWNAKPVVVDASVPLADVCQRVIEVVHEILAQQSEVG